jgi:FlaG/FlaF family flagellin (archaellin)
MKKIFVIIAIVVVLAAALFASPILGREGRDSAQFVGTAYASEGGGGGF